MAAPKIVTNNSCSEKIVKRILVTETVVCVSVKQKFFKHPEEIHLITVGTKEGRVYLFDVRRNPDLVHSGQLWRILACDELTKVMHDCRNASIQLQKQFGVNLKNVFDTQAAFCILLRQRGMPTRLIDLVALYEKFGNSSQNLVELLQESTETGGIYWAQRPMPKEMIYYAASDVLALLPDIYENLKSEIATSHDDFKHLCKAYVHGRFECDNDLLIQPPAITTKMTTQQQRMLHGTVPKSAGLMY